MTRLRVEHWGDEQRPESFLRRALLSPLLPVSWGWSLGAQLHRASFTSGLRRTERLPCAVIAVGSPLVGGTGKTPVSAFLAAALAERGPRVVVASRGSGRRRKGWGPEPVRIVSDGERLWGNAEDCGDEPMWIAARCPRVPVLVAADRVQAGRMACSVFAADVLVLDDGLQHHRVEHDVAIATLDGVRGLGNRHMLPRGPLRESPSLLGRCDALLTIGDSLRDEQDIAALSEGVLSVQARREISGVRGIGRRDAFSPTSLDGLEVGLLTAIACPGSFRASIEERGGRVIAERLFRDHHRYRARDLRGLRDLAPIWLTSEKDAVKLRADWLREVDMRVVASELCMEAPGAFLEWLEERAGLAAPAAIRRRA
ncbi:MAG: tetraacyldisaccharide 4'-kinase [Myxococcota bacterium]|nr:tetraacyldisaccharide 4'-kinase [Myxococcota bacterium]